MPSNFVTDLTKSVTLSASAVNPSSHKQRSPCLLREGILASVRHCEVARNAKSGPEGPLFCFNSPKEVGAGEGIRTLDPNLGKVVLYP